MHALLCFGAWIHKNLVDNAELVEAFGAKNKRKQEVIEVDSNEHSDEDA